MQKLFAFSILAILVASMFSALPLQTASAQPTIIATIPIPSPPSALSGNLVVDPDLNRIYLGVGNAFSFPGEVYVINGATDTLQTTIIPDPSSGGGSLAVNPLTHEIFFGNQAGGNSYLINTSDGDTFTVSNIAVPGLPTVSGVNPATNKFYSGNQGCPLGVCDGMSTIDGSTDTLLSGIAPLSGVAGGPAIVVDEGRNLIYASGAPAAGRVFNGATNPPSLVTSIPSFGPSTINQNTHKVYGFNWAGGGLSS